MSKHKPDAWKLLKMPDDYVRICAGWSGGYLDGDRWRLSSGIKEVQEKEEYYIFQTYSGTVYKCHKDDETVRMANAGIYEMNKEQGAVDISVEELSNVLHNEETS